MATKMRFFLVTNTRRDRQNGYRATEKRTLTKYLKDLYRADYDAGRLKVEEVGENSWAMDDFIVRGGVVRLLRKARRGS